MFKGKLHPKLKMIVFCASSQNYRHFFEKQQQQQNQEQKKKKKKIHAFECKFSEELKYGIEISVSYKFFFFFFFCLFVVCLFFVLFCFVFLDRPIEQNLQNKVSINKKRTAWPTKIPMPILSSLDNLLQDAYNIFQKSPGNFEKVHKTLSVLVWVQFPLNFSRILIPPCKSIILKRISKRDTCF